MISHYPLQFSLTLLMWFDNGFTSGNVIYRVNKNYVFYKWFDTISLAGPPVYVGIWKFYLLWNPMILLPDAINLTCNICLLIGLWRFTGNRCGCCRIESKENPGWSGIHSGNDGASDKKFVWWLENESVFSKVKIGEKVIVTTAVKS